MALVKYNNNSLSAITSTGLTAGAMTLIKSQTASSSSTISFVHGTSDVVLDGTYPIYLFKFINIHPATDNVDFMVLFRDGSSAFDATVTSSSFDAYHNEADDGSGLAYNTGMDLAQATSGQKLIEDQGNDNDQCGSGILHLFNPSSTTFVKHFIARTRNTHHANYTADEFIAGYCNVTAAIDGIQFKFSSGNIDSGTIKLYGIKDS